VTKKTLAAKGRTSTLRNIPDPKVPGGFTRKVLEEPARGTALEYEGQAIDKSKNQEGKVELAQDIPHGRQGRQQVEEEAKLQTQGEPKGTGNIGRKPRQHVTHEGKSKDNSTQKAEQSQPQAEYELLNRVKSKVRKAALMVARGTGVIKKEIERFIRKKNPKKRPSKVRPSNSRADQRMQKGEGRKAAAPEENKLELRSAIDDEGMKGLSKKDYTYAGNKTKPQHM